VIEEFRCVVSASAETSVGSMSLVSYADRTLQRGLRTSNADHLRRTRCAEEPLRRSAPRTVDAGEAPAILANREGFLKGRQVVAVHGLQDRHKYHFVSDELAFKQGVEKFVADLLLIREDARRNGFVATEPGTSVTGPPPGEKVQGDTGERKPAPLWRGFAERFSESFGRSRTVAAAWDMAVFVRPARD
jgi:hypothetical protein